jgi:hypothetical protein
MLGDPLSRFERVADSKILDPTALAAEFVSLVTHGAQSTAVLAYLEMAAHSTVYSPF